jgi:predicted MFS family arabinose efflux permease
LETLPTLLGGPLLSGVYRLWRDSGYAVGAVIAGLLADAYSLEFASFAVASLTFLSGLVVLLRMRETLRR